MTPTDPSGATVWWDRDIQAYCGDQAVVSTNTVTVTYSTGL